MADLLPRSILWSRYSVYAATKAAVETMTRIFAKELRGRNITVNAVAPGTDRDRSLLTGKSQDQIDHLSKMPPIAWASRKTYARFMRSMEV
jgi:NAD(P)-dependent dehydrogenase (short-subunit alcohol dehydrogenase family)